MLSATELARKWKENTKNSTKAYEDGVNAVTESPMEAAARQADAYASGVREAVESGKWQRRLRSKTTADWKEASIKKGKGRIAAGVEQAEGEMGEFYGEFLPHLEAGKRKLQSMPRGSLQDNIARCVATIEHNAGFQRKG